MDALVEGLMEELNCETVFTIPLFGGIPVYESVVVTWIIMAVVFLLCILLSRNLSVENPSRRQVVVETAIKGLNDFFTETVGEKGKAYIPYLSAIAIYIGIANLIGLLGFKPPTKDMNVTATLALMSIVLIEVAGIRARGTKGWLKSFAEPMPIILPINILEVHVAENFTGIPGVYVPLKETIRGFKAIIDGEMDEYPENAFFNVGTIDDVIKKAEKMQ